MENKTKRLTITIIGLVKVMEYNIKNSTKGADASGIHATTNVHVQAVAENTPMMFTQVLTT